MQHAAITRSDWRRRLRSGVFVRHTTGRRLRTVRLASASLVLLVLLSSPGAHAVSGGRAGQAQRPPGYLGIEFHDLTNEQAAALHLRDNRGVEVLLVDHDGPAASAGLEPHDLITGLNGHIVPSGEALRRMIHDTGAGVQVTLSVFRNGNPITIRTRLANRDQVERKAWARLNQPVPHGTVGQEFSGTYTTGPAPAPPVAAPRNAAPRSEGFIEKMVHGSSAGLMVEAMQPQLANYFGVPDGKGLLVDSVQDGSPAAVAGLHAGDVIVRADDQPMHSASDWSRHLHAAKGKPVSMYVVRDRQQMKLTLPAEASKR